MPLVELDHLFWLPGWRRADQEAFESAVAEAAAAERWIIDGQYELAHRVLRERADMVIWFDTAAHTAFTRLIRRTLRRLISREELWNGNRERVAGALLLLGWAAMEWGRGGAPHPVRPRPPPAHAAEGDLRAWPGSAGEA